MYRVILINGSEETVINEVTTDIKNKARITGTSKQGINSSDSFSFLIYTNNPGYNKIKSLSTLIRIENTITNEIVYEGRVLIPNEIMTNAGVFYKSITCESELSYLNDSVQFYKVFKNTDIKEILNHLILIHNQQADEDKQFKLGEVNISKKIDLTIEYKKTFEIISDIIKEIGGELRVQKIKNVRYLDYLNCIGEEKETTIELAKNLETIEKETDPTSIITQLLPLGAKKEDSEERLTIKSVNNNNTFLIDNDAAEEFGYHTDTQTWDDITDASELKKQGEKFLLENNRVKKKYKLSAYDLSLIGLDIDSFEVGNYYRVINPVMGIDEILRVIEKEIKIESPEASSLTIGDKFDDIKTYQINLNKVNKNMKNLISTTNSITNKVNTNNKIISEVKNENIILTEDVGILNDTIISINDRVGALETQMSTVLTDIQTIKSQLGVQ